MFCERGQDRVVDFRLLSSSLYAVRLDHHTQAMPYYDMHSELQCHVMPPPCPGRHCPECYSLIDYTLAAYCARSPAVLLSLCTHVGDPGCVMVYVD